MLSSLYCGFPPCGPQWKQFSIKRSMLPDARKSWLPRPQSLPLYCIVTKHTQADRQSKSRQQDSAASPHSVSLTCCQPGFYRHCRLSLCKHYLMSACVHSTFICLLLGIPISRYIQKGFRQGLPHFPKKEGDTVNNAGKLLEMHTARWKYHINKS